MKDVEDTGKGLAEKLQDLKGCIRGHGSGMIAFSGGVDSAFLLKVAHDVLGERVTAVTVSAPIFPKREQDEARAFCREHGIRHIMYSSAVLEDEKFCSNPADRCYICKKQLFGGLLQLAHEEGASWVAEGSNMDDTGDYRPGLQAVEELGIKSPLRCAGLYKSEIRQLSRQMGLPTWEKPSFACLATRIPYGEMITEQKLSMAAQGERFLFDLGFRQMRVRVHGKMARIEVMPAEFGKLWQDEIRKQVVARFREIGFAYISMDLEGYRTGSMNEVLDKV